VVLGISEDTLKDQERFTVKEKLNFPLLADNHHKVAKEFGVLMSNGKFAKRATFIIGKDGRIAKIFPAVGNAGGHAEEVLAWVRTHLAKKE
jgi:peroxiredoxin Q/BCP